MIGARQFVGKDLGKASRRDERERGELENRIVVAEINAVQRTGLAERL
jgi:hypothetical protein